MSRHSNLGTALSLMLVFTAVTACSDEEEPAGLIDRARAMAPSSADDVSDEEAMALARALADAECGGDIARLETSIGLRNVARLLFKEDPVRVRNLEAAHRELREVLHLTDAVGDHVRVDDTGSRPPDGASAELLAETTAAAASDGLEPVARAARLRAVANEWHEHEPEVARELSRLAGHWEELERLGFSATGWVALTSLLEAFVLGAEHEGGSRDS